MGGWEIGRDWKIERLGDLENLRCWKIGDSAILGESENGELGSRETMQLLISHTLIFQLLNIPVPQLPNLPIPHLPISQSPISPNTRVCRSEYIMFQPTSLLFNFQISTNPPILRISQSPISLVHILFIVNFQRD